MAETVLLLAIKKIGIALANEVTSKAISQFAKHAVQLSELQGSMGRIMRELRVMHDFLCQMDIRSRNNQVYQGWLEEVRKMVYVMEDMVDEYMYLVGRERDLGFRFFLKRSFRQPRSILPLDRIASMVKETEKNLAHLSQTKERWVLITNNGNSSYNIVHGPQDLASISCSLSEEDLVGIEDNKQKLIDLLEDGDPACFLIVVHGMGGLGKTSLASAVYRKEREKFDCYAWVSISQTYTREDILRRLIVEIFRDKPNAPSNIATMDKTALQDTLKSSLEQKKYLIVLDDVWTPQVYNNDLFGVLVPNLRSKIVITTRNANVGHLTVPERCLELKRLSERNSWELFCRKAFLNQHECPKELKDLSEKIVFKCEGLPLAIVSLGRLLSVRGKTRVEWSRVLDQLSWELINNIEMGHVRNILHLSYMYLPTSLKSCFLYCSLFPEDYLFKRKEFIRYWIAEGFVENRGRSTPEEVAEGYIKELVYMNMLQLVERNTFDRIKSFRMHDIVRELAVDLCRRECFGTAYNDEDKQGESTEKKDGRRMVIHGLTVDPAIILSVCHLRSLIVLDKSTPSSSRILPVIVENIRYMSVLELTGLPIDKVPDAIGDLFNLRHFGLRDSKVKYLPDSIEKLSNLLTLDIFDSEIQGLPSGIVKLKKLRHLFAQKLNDSNWRTLLSCNGVRILKGLKELTELQTLQALELHDDGPLRHLKELKQMRSLRISGVTKSFCEGLCQSLHQMKFLSHLDIIASGEDEVLELNGLSPLPPNLERLGLRGRLAQADMLLGAATTPGGQNNLCSVQLHWSQLEEDPLPSLSRWSLLTQLRFTRAYVGEKLVFQPGWFPHLKELYLGDMPNLNLLDIHQGTMTSLQELLLVNLSGMVQVPRGIEFVVPTLKSLFFWEITRAFRAELRNCPRLDGIRWRYNLKS
uniref:AAA+ ATPase domain-containing protein n=1 Tax=Leersia perrieri TaxID=77586 RepID=A0A0D9XVN1_9ORYZ